MTLRNLYFINSRHQYRLLGENVSEEEVFKLIKKFLAKHKFKSYYTSWWDTFEGRKYDVGSHTEFFLWGEHDDND